MKRVYLVLVVAALTSCTSSETTTVAPTTPATSETRGQVIQERLVKDITRAPAKLRLTCNPGECTPSQVAAPTVVLEDASGLRYRLGPIVWDGDNVVSAEVTTAQGSSVAPVPAVAVHLDADGAQQLLAATAGAFGADPPRNQIAVVVNGRVIQAPIVQGPISAGAILVVPFSFTEEDAKTLAASLSPG
jgi:preprotein translocase subunit SecD